MAAARRLSHDQLLKEAVTAFLPDFVTLFAPEQAAQLDLRTYLDLTSVERTRLLTRLDQEGATTVKTSELTWAERTRREGRTEGETKGRAEAILVLLRDKFNSIPPELERRVRATTDPAELDALLLRTAHATTFDDL